jgi:hypothetical protein
MSSDFLQDLVCSCKGKSISSSSCLFWTECVVHRSLSLLW